MGRLKGGAKADWVKKLETWAQPGGKCPGFLWLTNPRLDAREGDSLEYQNQIMLSLDRIAGEGQLSWWQPQLKKPLYSGCICRTNWESSQHQIQQRRETSSSPGCNESLLHRFPLPGCGAYCTSLMLRRSPPHHLPTPIENTWGAWLSPRQMVIRSPPPSSSTTSSPHIRCQQTQLKNLCYATQISHTMHIYELKNRLMNTTM